MDDALPMLSQIHEAGLTAIVRGYLGSDTARVSLLACDGVTGGLSGGSVYRVSGTAVVGAASRPWSLIVKVLRETEATAARSGPYYWRRERDVAVSTITDDLPDGLSAARFVATTDRSPSEVWLWFEDLGPEPDPRTTEAWAAIAGAFARWQAPYLLGKPPPSHPWLPRNWLEQWCLDSGPVDLDGCADDPLLRRMYPDSAAASAQNFWRGRARYFAAYRQLPCVVTHMDAFWRNLFVVEGRAVAIDWALAGIEPVGAELNSLIFTNIVSQEVEPGEYDTFDRDVFAGYIAGLREAGWRGDTRHVRLACVLACCLRGVTRVSAFATAVAADPDESTWREIADFIRARDLDEVIEQVARANLFLADRVAEANMLLDEGVPGRA
jgi:hypothetical protein